MLDCGMHMGFNDAVCTILKPDGMEIGGLIFFCYA